MNVNDEFAEALSYSQFFGNTKSMLEMHLKGPCELLLSTDTLQYSDYDKYDSEMFDKEAKAKRNAEVFPRDCEHAFEMGVRMAS